MAIARFMNSVRLFTRFILLGVPPLCDTTPHSSSSFSNSLWFPTTCSFCTDRSTQTTNQTPDHNHLFNDVSLQLHVHPQYHRPLISSHFFLAVIDAHHAPHIRFLLRDDCTYARGPGALIVRMLLPLVIVRPLRLAYLFYACPTCTLSWILDVLSNSPSLKVPYYLNHWTSFPLRSLAALHLHIPIGHPCLCPSVDGQLYSYLFTMSTTPIDHRTAFKCSVIGFSLRYNGI
jgi:hypothetical protein